MHPFDTLNLDNGARLIFTPCPGTKEASLPEALKTLQAAGADAVVTLMPSAELAQFQADAMPAECATLGLAWFHLPVEDDCAPEAPFSQAFASHKADLLARLAAGQTLAGETWRSKGGNCPFIGHCLPGQVRYTLVDGRISYQS